MAYQEFYSVSGGNNLNGGSSSSTTASVTSTNGSWNSGTLTFVCSDSPDLSGVTTGMYASVCVDGATGDAVFIARVTSANNGTKTITLSSSHKTGTAPTTNGTARTIRIGGAWGLPSGTSIFPAAFSLSACLGPSTEVPRWNILSSSTISLTTALAITSGGGPLVVEGGTSSAGDQGLVTIDVGTYTGQGISCSQAKLTLRNLKATSSATSGTGIGIYISGDFATVEKCKATGFRSHGINCAQVNGRIADCESWGNNTSNSAGTAGIYLTNGGTVVRCNSHDNNMHGFFTANNSYTATFLHCVADTNTGVGFAANSAVGLSNCEGCTSYGNGTHGFSGITSVVNCAIVSNGSYGVTTTAGNRCIVQNCTFYGNTSGETSNVSEKLNCISAGSAPLSDPANGDFLITDTSSITGGLISIPTTGSYSGSTSPLLPIGLTDQVGSSGGGSGGGGSVFGSAIIRGLGAI